ncbi:MAG: DUF4346 domain-containing protein [Candidatus Melainabacteria bacterium]
MSSPTPEANPPEGFPREETLRDYQLTLFARDPFETKEPLAICTLTDDALRDDLQQLPELQGILIGGLHTENIGIEQIVSYVVGNPHIRFIVLCGLDGKQAIGQLPGASFLALGQHGVDDKNRIINAPGKRPILQNVPKAALDHFRETVSLVDLVNNRDIPTILNAVSQCRCNNPGPAAPFYTQETITVLEGYTHFDMLMDPRGYMVIQVDQDRGTLVMKQYTNNGILETIIEGPSASSIYIPAVDRGLITRMDHAAYIGKELARAEQALKEGWEYVQDALG